MGLCSGDASGASKQDTVPATRDLRFRWFGPDVRTGSSEIMLPGDTSPRNSKDGKH